MNENTVESSWRAVSWRVSSKLTFSYRTKQYFNRDYCQIPPSITPSQETQRRLPFPLVLKIFWEITCEPPDFTVVTHFLLLEFRQQMKLFVREKWLRELQGELGDGQEHWTNSGVNYLEIWGKLCREAAALFPRLLRYRCRSDLSCGTFPPTSQGKCSIADCNMTI